MSYDPDNMDFGDPEELRGTLTEGECMYCGADDGMKYHGNCFICDVCGRSTHEDTYYEWYSGNDIHVLNDDGDYETIFGR